jgi:hypothetical protein
VAVVVLATTAVQDLTVVAVVAVTLEAMQTLHQAEVLVLVLQTKAITVIKAGTKPVHSTLWAVALVVQDPMVQQHQVQLLEMVA